MSYYQNYLKHYTKLNFYISQISVWIKSNQIDRIYHALLSAEKEIQFMYPIDDQAILLKLFKNHDLYQKRYDILERYLKIA
tara:strand:+ start:343 stop:585 length:243 start_codon:yes stop_codon:yes gene_type:complete